MDINAENLERQFRVKTTSEFRLLFSDPINGVISEILVQWTLLNRITYEIPVQWTLNRITSVQSNLILLSSRFSLSGIFWCDYVKRTQLNN